MLKVHAHFTLILRRLCCLSAARSHMINSIPGILLSEMRNFRHHRCVFIKIICRLPFIICDDCNRYCRYQCYPYRYPHRNHNHNHNHGHHRNCYPDHSLCVLLITPRLVQDAGISPGLMYPDASEVILIIPHPY